MSGRRHPADLELTRARDIQVGDRLVLEGRGLSPWKVTASYERAESSQYWSLTLKRGKETNIIRTFSDSWFDKVS